MIPALTRKVVIRRRIRRGELLAAVRLDDFRAPPGTEADLLVAQISKTDASDLELFADGGGRFAILDGNLVTTDVARVAGASYSLGIRETKGVAEKETYVSVTISSDKAESSQTVNPSTCFRITDVRRSEHSSDLEIDDVLGYTVAVTKTITDEAGVDQTVD